MRFLSCERARDALPDMLAGRLDRAESRATAAHLEACAECRAEAELLERLRRHPVAVPPGLEARVIEAVLRPVDRRRLQWRPLAAVAVTAAVLLGGALLLSRARRAPLGDAAIAEAEAVATSGELFRPFSGSPAPDGLLAGGVRLEELSTEELELLLAELD